MSDKTNKSDEQKVAEAEVEGFRKDLGPFVVAAEKTRMAMVFSDAKELDNPIIFANDAFLLLTGYAREEVLGQSFNFLMAHGGFVTLMNDRRGKASSLSSSRRSSSLTPRLHGRGSEDSVRASGGEMTLNVEGVVGGRVEGQEPLG